MNHGKLLAAMLICSASAACTSVAPSQAVPVPVVAHKAAPAASAAPAAAVSSAALDQRGADLVKLINGSLKPQQVFAPAFFGVVSEEKIVGLLASLRSNYGPALGAETVTTGSPRKGTVLILFEKKQIPLKIMLDRAEPHLIVNLQT